jgi:hypothetical protein
LHLACIFVGLAFSFQLLGAEDLPDGLFHGSLGMFCGAFLSIAVSSLFIC